MLAKRNRLLAAEDFRSTMRTGLKVSSKAFVIYLKRDLSSTQSRFGFVVAKAVGNAVVRNRLKRRLRELSKGFVNRAVVVDVVVRALPESAKLDWNALSSDYVAVVEKAFERGRDR